MTTTVGGLDEFLYRARKHLLPEPVPPLARAATPFHGDHRLDGYEPPATSVEASVLVPVLAHPAQPTLLFTQRASTLRQHSGQVAFPGGRSDPEDSGPAATALREAQEEIGLAPAGIEILGYLEPYLTGSGYRITPVVGLVSPGFTPHLNPAEVDLIFESPLDALMREESFTTMTGEWRGKLRTAYVMDWRDHYIWGVTAGILRLLYERIYR